MDDFPKLLPLDSRHLPAYFSLVVLGMLLLVFRDLSDDFRHYITPSLLVFCLGSSLISHIHVTLGNRAGKGVKIKPWIYTAIIVAHVIWFGLFVGYNYYYIYHIPTLP